MDRPPPAPRSLRKRAAAVGSASHAYGTALGDLLVSAPLFSPLLSGSGPRGSRSERRRMGKEGSWESSEQRSRLCVCMRAMSEMRTPNTNVVTNPFIMCAASILTVTVPDSPRAQVDLVAAADERGRSIFSSANDGGSGDDDGGGGGDGGEQIHTRAQTHAHVHDGRRRRRRARSIEIQFSE